MSVASHHWILLVRGVCHQPGPLPDDLRAEDIDKVEVAVLYYMKSTDFEVELGSLTDTGKVPYDSRLAALQPWL